MEEETERKSGEKPVAEDDGAQAPLPERVKTVFSFFKSLLYIHGSCMVRFKLVGRLFTRLTKSSGKVVLARFM